MQQPTSWQSAGDGSSPASPATQKKLSASASGEPVWNESFSIDVLRHMELELWEHNPADGDKLAGKKTVNLTLDVFPEADPPLGVETVKTFAIPGAGRVELGFTLLPPGSEAEPSTSPEPPTLTKNDKRRSIIGERRTVNRALDQFSEAEASSSVEQLRQVNEALIAMGKPPLTKQEAALILAGEKKRRETLVLPKGVGAAINSAAQSSPNGQETKWMAKRTSIAPRSRDSSAAIYSQFKQQIYLKDKEVADKAKQVDALEQEVLAAKQEVAHQKTLLKTKSMQFLVVFEKVKEEKDALVAANARLREEMEDREREHREALARLARDLDEKVRLAREEGSLSTTLAYSIKLENEKANHGRELARVKSDLEFETEQIRKKAEAEKQGLVLQYEGLLQKERARSAEELRKKKEKSREKKQRLREERLQKEGVTQEMKRMEEKIQGDKRKWEEEREHVRAEQAERESQLERERRENERLAGSIAGLEERIGLLEKKLHQAQAEKQSLAADFAEQQETARGVAEMQLRRVREEAASTRERLEADLEALKLKLHQAGEREQAAVERERREKLELKEAKVKLESECLERAARLERLAGVEQDLRAAQARIEAVQKAAETEAREKNRLLEEKREADRQAELLEAELRRAHEEAEAKAHELEQQMIAAAAAAARPPSAPMPPPMVPFAGAAAAAAAVGSLGDDGSDSDDGGVGGLLGAIAKGVTLQPVKPDTKPRPHKAEGEVESISEAIALAIARRREMMMLAAPTATMRGDDDTPWDAGDLYE